MTATAPHDDTPDGRRADLLRQLTIAGWLLLGGPLGFIAFQFDRVRNVGEQPFAGIWDQRIEVISFLMLPPNLVVLAPTVLVAVVAAWLAGPDRDPWLGTLLRVNASLAIAFAVIGAVSITSIIARDEPASSDIEGIFLRIGGIAMAAGLAWACRSVDRSPGAARSGS